jgi:hypothetical protein
MQFQKQRHASAGGDRGEVGQHDTDFDKAPRRLVPGEEIFEPSDREAYEVRPIE